jgi:CheY-like chemotaxis protein
MVVSWSEPVRTPEMGDWVSSEIGSEIDLGHLSAMEPASDDGMPGDVLIVEDDPIIALDFEDTILGFGVTRLRTARSVAKALEMIAERAPDFALLDVGLVREKSFAIAERLEALTIPFIFVTGYGSPGTFPAAFAHKPTLPKPYSSDALRALLTSRAGRKLTPGATCP